MESTSTPAISSLQSLLFLARVEEKRLRTILATNPAFRLKMQTQVDLENLLRRTSVQSEELEKLRAAVE
jgi:hypothetical protein